MLGGGAGLSDAAGLRYAGPRFTEHFADFIKKYGMTDMYTAGFYPFSSEEARWGYWARHILFNRFDPPALPLYQALLALVRGKEYFVVTTNVDQQAMKAGFEPSRIFAAQGDYGQIQCARACHDTLYDDEAMVRRMAANTKDCLIPAGLVPRCHVCGGPMDVHIRKDASFIEDDAWRQASTQYTAFLQRAAAARVVFLELGVGYNTPSVIRYPFEQMTYRFKNATLIRLNRDYPDGAAENAEKTVAFAEDMAEVIEALRE